MATGWPRGRAQAHLEHLALRDRIQLLWLPSGARDRDAESTPGRFPLVRTQRPYSARLYLIGLHEFGHILSPLAVELWQRDNSVEPDSEIEHACEGAAWAKAIQLADPSLLRLCRKRDFEAAGELMSSYAWWSARRARAAR